MIDDERLSCPLTEMVHIRTEAGWRGIEPQDNSTTRGKLSKSWGVCQVIDVARLATTIHTPGMAIHREDPVFEAEDFGTEFTPELREQEERLRAQSEQLKKAPKR
jgi:hypothetical protein